MGKYLEIATSPRILNRAWRYLRDDQGLWHRGVTLQEVRRDLIEHVGELAVAIRTGRYHPGPMRCHTLTQADGSQQRVCAADARDRLLQHAVLIVLEPLGEKIFHEASFAFRPHRTREMAVARIQEYAQSGQDWLGKAQIQACFDSIPHKPLLKRLFRLCGDRELVMIIRAWLESLPVEHRSAGLERGLPQGMVLSPFLCNFHLNPLDNPLTRKHWPFVRFADQWVLFGRSPREAAQALRGVRRPLKRLGLELDRQRSQVIRFSAQQPPFERRLPHLPLELPRL